ncbi:ABC transporter substrate-binding protein [Thalassobaculum sp.]|uniref:ABC transporter substrate-binding protein n=1 Tax=Thalassobaculum sp. TaxID=2022740 RepID=UPI0032EFCE62
MSIISYPSRRQVLLGTAAAVAGLSAPSIVRAQSEPIRLGALNPLTGAGGSYGPTMRRAIEGVIERVNGAGGINGRKVELAGEDTQTNPDAAVRAARKLIDVDKVSAIMGTWASSVTTAVAPLCWESKVFITTVSGSDTITKLPHQGYLIRTQPNTHLQIQRLGEFLLSLGNKKVFVLAAQTPFALPSQERLTEVLKAGGSEMIGGVIYDKDKTSFRSEIDQALKAKPDMIYLNGYTPDVTIVLRELYKAGYEGGKVGQAYAVNQKLLESLPPEVTEGTYTVAQSPSINSDAYKRLATFLQKDVLDPYSCQCNDQASLVCLAIAKAGNSSGTAIKDAVRSISQGPGEKVDDVVDGLKALAAGKDINFEGASGACDFDDIGDILTTNFRYEQVEKGAFKLLKIA